MSNGADSELALHEALQAVELFVAERRAILDSRSAIPAQWQPSANNATLSKLD